MNERTIELNEIMKQYELNVDDVAKILDRSSNTIWQWKAGTRRTIPLFALNFLKSEIARI